MPDLSRVARHAGRADPEALAEIRGWITDFVNE
jgi:hypothetical protein